ncbi:unnamed protein product [Orchesella dallaii]|uniref:Odorant receptor n=1 Tax=Orchesella dallaii TaxID=48710 RepID=A0ABP1RPB9_9HEXA
MPSPLTHHSYKLQKFINDRLYQGRTYWDDDEEKWKLESNWRKLIPYYIFNYFFVNTLFVGFIVLIFSTMVYIPDALPFESCIIFVLVSLAIPYSIAVDVVFHFFSSEVLQIVNWMDEKRDQHFRTQQTKPWKLGSPSIFLHELSNVRQNQDVDFIGLVQNITEIDLAISSIIIPLLLVWGDWDPIHLTVIILPTFGWPNLSSNLWVKLIRIVVTFIWGQAIFFNIRCLNIVGLNVLFGYLKLLKRLLSLDLNHSTMREYKQIYITVNMLEAAIKFLLGILLGIEFAAIILGVNVTIMGFRLGNFPMSLVASMIAIIGLWGTWVCFIVGCSWYEVSEQMLQSWRWQVVDSLNRKDMRKRVKSCRIMTLVAGGIGILDDTIKNTFFHSALTYTANLLLATKNSF